LRQPAAPNKTDKTETNNKNDIDPLAENLDLSSLREGLERALTCREGTKPYNTRATITKWIRRNGRTRKDTTKHDGGYSRTRRSDLFENNSNPEPGAD